MTKYIIRRAPESETVHEVYLTEEEEGITVNVTSDFFIGHLTSDGVFELAAGLEGNSVGIKTDKNGYIKIIRDGNH